MEAVRAEIRLGDGFGRAAVGAAARHVHAAGREPRQHLVREPVHPVFLRSGRPVGIVLLGRGTEV